MSEILAEPRMHLFAVCTSILVLKMLLTGHLTAVLRNMKGAYVSPEDYAFRGKDVGPADEQIERVRRAHRNDLESILPFFAVAFLFALSGAASYRLTWWLFVTFTLARIAHTIVYGLGLQPWRSIVFGVGDVTLVATTVLLLAHLL